MKHCHDVICHLRLVCDGPPVLRSCEKGGSWGQGRPPVVAPDQLQVTFSLLSPPSSASHQHSGTVGQICQHQLTPANSRSLTKSLSSSLDQDQLTNYLSPRYHEATRHSRIEQAMLKKMWEPTESWIPLTFSDWRFNYKMSLQSQLSTSKVLGWQSSLTSGPILLLAVVLLHNPTNGKRGCKHGGSWLVSKHELSNIEVGRREMLQ